MQNGKVESYVSRADAGLGRVSTREALENPNRRVLLDMVGVKYVIAQREDFWSLRSTILKRFLTLLR